MAGNVVVTALKELTPLMEESIADGGQVILTVTGNSMRPLFFHRRDQVVLEKCDPKALRIGDIPLYRRQSGQYVLHRVVGIGVSSYTMCGDGQWEKEYGISYKNIIGVVTGFYRKGKYYACSHRGYGLFVRFWMGTFPIRRLLLCVDSLGRRTVRFVRRILTKKG